MNELNVFTTESVCAVMLLSPRVSMLEEGFEFDSRGLASCSAEAVSLHQEKITNHYKPERDMCLTLSYLHYS